MAADFYNIKNKTLLKNRPTVSVRKLVTADLKATCKKAGVPFEKVFELMRLDYTEYENGVFKLMAEYMGVDPKKITPEIAGHFAAAANEMWLYENGREFVVSFNKLGKIPEAGNLDGVDLDAIVDSYISFVYTDGHGAKRYLSDIISFTRQEDLYDWNGSPNTMPYMVRTGKHDSENHLIQVAFTKESYPSTLAEPLWYYCDKCPVKNIKPIKLRRQNDIDILTTNLCETHEEQCPHCFMYKRDVTPAMAVNIVAYVARMYASRYSLNRKNSRHIDTYRSAADIDVVRTKRETGERDEVPLLLYSKTDKDYIPHKGTAHGSHASPREHERREHTRTLRSGKVVSVSHTTVNKGYKKVVYRI